MVQVDVKDKNALDVVFEVSYKKTNWQKQIMVGQ